MSGLKNIEQRGGLRKVVALKFAAAVENRVDVRVRGELKLLAFKRSYDAQADGRRDHAAKLREEAEFLRVEKIDTQCAHRGSAEWCVVETGFRFLGVALERGDFREREAAPTRREQRAALHAAGTVGDGVGQEDVAAAVKL